MAVQSSDSSKALNEARDAYGRQDWTVARGKYRAAAEQVALSVDDWRPWPIRLGGWGSTTRHWRRTKRSFGCT